ncbi:replicative DNA helicase [Paenibacillus massiliensis]|uniref:replicative DNA helicase n=1 Tax=Paenibacillus massiliensis TaxID=225917 RepID=UPI0004227006|nr:replicative DNA helicase [Paenibacillus massiliensis]
MLTLEVLNIDLPSHPEAEMAVLGALIADQTGEVVEDSLDRLNSNLFTDRIRRTVYQAIEELTSAGEPVDMVTIMGQLQEQGKLEEIGGVSYLSGLTSSAVGATETSHYIGMLQEVHTRRQIIKAGLSQMNQAMGGNDLQQLLANMQSAATKMADRVAPAEDFKPIGSVLLEVVESSEIRSENYRNGVVTGVPTGFCDLDSITGGFQKNDLIIVAARPSVGKTAFALNIAQNVAVRAKETVAIFSLEMSAAQLVQRMICAEGNLDASKMRMGDFAEDDWTKLATAAGVLGASNIMIDDSPGITVYDIRAKCRRLKKQRGLGLIVIDYLQLISGTGKSKGAENRQQEVSEISRTLKQLARELEVPVIALSQLSRGVEQRQDKRPMMSDLRESGSLEQDADIVGFLYRDDYYNQDSEKKNIIEIIIAKQRNGPVGTVELVFLKNYNKFATLERAQQEFWPEASQPPKDIEKRMYA